MEEFNKKVKKKLSTTTAFLITMLLNCIFLCVWVAAQYLAANFIDSLKTDEMNYVVLFVFRFIFALSTLVPIAIRFYADTRIMLIQTEKEINKEINNPISEND